MVYVIDSYRLAVGETTVYILAFKGENRLHPCTIYFVSPLTVLMSMDGTAAFGFLLSFYTNPWIDKVGDTVAFGEMACIAGAIRHCTWKWPVMEKYGHWGSDREVGG